MASPVTGIDPDYLEALKAFAAQMAPTEADKKQALIQGLLGMSAGALSNAYKPWQLGASGAIQGGLLGYNQELQHQEQLKNQSIAQAAQLFSIGKQNKVLQQQTQMYDQMYKLLNPQAQTQTTPAQGLLGGVSDAMSGIDPTASALLSGVAQGNAAAAPAAAGPPADLREQLAKVNLLGNLAGLKDMSPAIKTMFPEGVALRAGAPMVNPATGAVMNANAAPPPGMYFDPTSNSYKTVPGGPEAFAAQAGRTSGATKQAESEHELFTVKLSDGTELQLPKDQAVALLRQGQASAAAPAVAPTSQPQVSYGPTTAQPNATLPPAQLAAAQRDFALNGAGVPAAPAAPGPAMGRTANPVVLKAAESEASKAGENLGNQATQVDTEARAAQDLVARTGEMRNLLKYMNTGAASPMRLDVAKWGAAAGLPDSVVNSIAGGDVGAMQALGKQAVQGAFAAARQALGSGQRITQNEVLTMANASPNLSLTKEAINAMLDFQDGVSKWQLDRQQAKDAWISGSGSYKGFEADWNKNHPLNDYVPSSDQLEKALFPNGMPKTAPTQQSQVPAAPQLTAAGQGNATVQMIIQQAVKNGDSAAIDKLRAKGYVQ